MDLVDLDFWISMVDFCFCMFDFFSALHARSLFCFACSICRFELNLSASSINKKPNFCPTKIPKPYRNPEFISGIAKFGITKILVWDRDSDFHPKKDRFGIRDSIFGTGSHTEPALVHMQPVLNRNTPDPKTLCV